MSRHTSPAMHAARASTLVRAVVDDWRGFLDRGAPRSAALIGPILEPVDDQLIRASARSVIWFWMSDAPTS